MNPTDTLLNTQTFVAAVRVGSFTRAAERLGLTKSAVGKRVARLESELGLPLLRRGGRTLHLTPDGRQYFETCARALDDMELAQAALAPAHGALQGPVRLSLPVAYGRRILLPLLLRCSAPHPGLQLRMAFQDATVDLVGEDVDVAVRFGTVADSGQLVARRLCRQTRVVCAAPAYLAAHGEPRTIEALQTHRCIVGTPDGPPRTWKLREDDGTRLVTPPATHAFNDGEAIIDAAVAGFGLCQMPSSLLRGHLARGELLPVLSHCADVPVDVCVLWPRRATQAQRVRFIVDALIAAGESGALD